MTVVVIILAIHIAICVALTMIYKREEQLHKDNLLPLLYTVPVFGAICFMLRRGQLLHHKTSGVEIERSDRNVLKGKYAKIEVEDADMMSAQVVPLEEALLLNDAEVRHNLMLNILYKNPTEYLEMLQRARNSDDTEVIHYATTMMMEVLTEYEKKLQYYDREYKKTPDDRELIWEYIQYMQEFIHSKLVTGNLEKVYRKKMALLLDSYMSGQKKLGRGIFITIENYLALGEYEKAHQYLELAKKEFPEDERLFRLYGHYYDARKEYHKLQEMVHHIKENHIYMSREGMEWLTFWS